MQKLQVPLAQRREKREPARMGTFKRMALGLGLAAGIHCTALTSNLWEPMVERGIARIGQKYAEYSIMREREELVEGAKKDLQEGKLELGKFLIAANMIDAEERGEELDKVAALARYEDYKILLRESLRFGNAPHEAIVDALRWVEYFGGVGGRIADPLINKGGNCEAITHLAVALLYDAGLGKNTYFRVYKGHLAPTYVEGGKEYDLSGGKYAEGGIMLPAAYLIGAYEKATLAKGGSRKGMGGFAYPETKDEYSGQIPLFAERALKPFREKETVTGSAAGAREDGGAAEIEKPFLEWALEELFWLLDPLPAQRGASTVDFRPQYEKKSEKWLQAFCAEIVYTEEKLAESGDDAETLQLLSKLGIAYAQAHWEAALMGKGEVAKSAEDKRQGVIKFAKELIEKIDWGNHDEKMRIMREISMDIGSFAFLGNAGDRVIGMYIAVSGYNVYPVAAFIAKPSTREEGLARYAKLNPLERIKVLGILRDHEVDIEKGWEPKFVSPLVGEISDEYSRKYPCYGKHPTLGGIEGLVRSMGAEAKVGNTWNDRIIAYFIQQSLSENILCAHFGTRPENFKTESVDGYKFLKEAKAWVEGKQDAGLDAFRKRINGLLDSQEERHKAR